MNQHAITSRMEVETGTWKFQVFHETSWVKVSFYIQQAAFQVRGGAEL